MRAIANRARYERRGLGYPDDLTDEERALIEPLIPPAKHGGNKRTVDLRAVVDGVMYVLSTGRRAARSTTTSGAGIWTARWRASITRSTTNA